MALVAKEQGRQAGFTSREKKQWKGSPYEWRYQYSISLPTGRMERRDEEENKIRQRDARGSLFPRGRNSLCKQNAFF
jgi:hypothetical protein